MEDQTIVIDEFHKHELLDRIHCINTMFEEMIANHPAADLMRAQIDNAASVLGDLYCMAGEIRAQASSPAIEG